MRYYSQAAIFKGQDVRVVSIHTAEGRSRGLGPGAGALKRSEG